MRIRIFAAAIAAAVMLSGCTVRTADAGTELTQEEKEIKAVSEWFSDSMTDEDEFADSVTRSVLKRCGT